MTFPPFIISIYYFYAKLPWEKVTKDLDRDSLQQAEQKKQPYNPFPGVVTTLSWHWRCWWEFFPVLCHCQARPVSSPSKEQMPESPFCPCPLGHPSLSLLVPARVVKLLGSAPGSNNSSGNLFAPSVPLQVAWSNGAKTQQTKVQSVETQNRNKTVPAVTTELRKSRKGLIACRTKKGTVFVPGLQNLHMSPSAFIRHFPCVRK